MAAFFLTGQTRSHPAWPFFFAGRRRNDRPDRVRPGLAIQKNAAYVVHFSNRTLVKRGLLSYDRENVPMPIDGVYK